MKHSHYETLGIDPAATKDEIKDAFRSCSKHYHPDANTAPNAALVFRMMVEARDVLLDDGKRAAYDNSLGITGNTGRNRDINGYPPYRERRHTENSTYRGSRNTYGHGNKNTASGSVKKRRSFGQYLARLPITLSVLLLRGTVYFTKVVLSIFLVPAGCVAVLLFGVFGVASVGMAIYTLMIIFGDATTPLGSFLLVFGLVAGITAILNPFGGPLPSIVASLYSGLDKVSGFLKNI